MKKKICFLFSLLFALLLSLQGAQGESAPLLYRVSNEAGNTVYLLGTIHVGDEEMYPLGETVEKAYQEAEILAVEIDLIALEKDMEKMLRYTMACMYGAGESAKDVFSPETYALALEKLEQPEALMNMMRPAMWMSLAQEQSYARLGMSSEWGVDHYLLKRAHEDGKTIVELETLEEQIETLLSLPDAMADYDLWQMLSYPEAADISMQLLFAAWKQGNAEIFSLLLAQEEAAVPAELREEYAAYAEKMYTLRDDAFEKDVVSFLESGKCVLFAVGAAHIIGDDALASRLEAAGYLVEEIRN